MASPPNLTQISFSGGIDESVHGEVLDPSVSFRVLQNGRQNRQGGYDKRLGTQPLPLARSGASSRSSGRRMFGFSGSPCVIDSNGVLDIYAESKSTAFTCGRLASATYALKSLPSVSASDPVTDIEIVNGCMAVAYASGSLAVIDVTTGVNIAPILRGGSANNISATEVTSYGGQFFIAYAFDGSAGVVIPYAFDTASPTSGWVAQTTITGVTFMSCASAGTCSLLMYSTGGTVITIAKYLVTGTTAGTTITGVTLPANFDIVVSPDFSTMWLAYVATNITVQSLLVATPTTVVSTPNGFAANMTGIASLVAGDTSTTITLLISGVNVSNDRGVFVSDVANVAGATTFANSTRTYGVQVCGRGVRQNGRTLIPVYGSPDASVGANFTSTLTIVDATDVQPLGGNSFRILAPVANIEPGIIFLSSGQTIPLISNKLAFDATGKVYCAFASKSGGGVVPATYFGSTSVNNRVAALDFTSRARWQIAEHAHGSFISGSVLNFFDGSSVVEAGFVVPPPQGVPVLSAGALSGVYRYVATYESVDASGNWAVSGVSTPVAVTTTNNTVTISYSPLSVTQKNGKNTTRLTIYRTLTGGAAPYYRLGIVANTPSPTGTKLSFVDNLADASISGSSKLYAPNLPGTAGESLDRRAPPGLVDVVSYNGMLVGIKGDSVINSGQLVYGEAPWFNPVFETPIAGGGDFVALELLVGTLFLFKRSRIYAISGTAPSDNAASGGLGDARLVASDVGCVEPNSVVSTSMGIFFQSTRGIELLDRSGSVTYVGFKITRTFATYPIVTSAVLDARNSLVRFSLASAVVNGAVSGSGVDVVYDLKLGIWVSTDDKTGQVAHETAQDAAIVTIGSVDRYAWLGVDGHVYVESLATDASAYLDGTTYIARAAESANFRVSGIQGTQQVNQVMLLERRATDHDATIALAYNYESAFRTPTTWTAATIAANLTAGWPVTQLKHQPHDDAICQGIRVRITDTAPSNGTVGNGQGSTWLALSLDITPKAGIFDVPDIAT